MKYIVALQNKMNMLQTKALNTLTKKNGQNTVEYVLMLVVVVGVALLAGKLIKEFMPDMFDNVKAKILGGINSSN